ncbi:hypothetical protein ABS71_03305 [bacterium SCN 62-11]|nr:MAG: hypothetical protein ABS71_03305 [bacterium SCN 62-11]
MRPPQEILEALRRSDVLRQLAVSDSGFLFDPRSGQSYSLNPTALEALEMMRLGFSLRQTAEELAKAYATTPEQAEGGLESFVQQLGRYLS